VLNPGCGTGFEARVLAQHGGGRGAPHGFPGFDCYDANPLFAEQARRDSGSGAHICSDEQGRRSEAIEHRVNRFGRVGRPIPDVVGRPIGESVNRSRSVPL
jgi:hypothetical protein